MKALISNAAMLAEVRKLTQSTSPAWACHVHILPPKSCSTTNQNRILSSLACQPTCGCLAALISSLTARP